MTVYADEIHVREKNLQDICPECVRPHMGGNQQEAWEENLVKDKREMPNQIGRNQNEKADPF
ncbi:hypothetical protein CCACVL1_05509 [Corchorus capsularis]|uniref:Uncharacterized protein n=1 Tax=Corchorus capsularis TaxID=210143 RepID=A0A1R3JK50_COCAP|nr:hypothetical protein CCACVL1_05509 [Corchorus capsularis]